MPLGASVSGMAVRHEFKAQGRISGLDVMHPARHMTYDRRVDGGSQIRQREAQPGDARAPNLIQVRPGSGVEFEFEFETEGGRVLLP